MDEKEIAFPFPAGTIIHWIQENLSSDRKAEGELTLRRLMSYIYGAPILDVSRSHTTTQHSR